MNKQNLEKLEREAERREAARERRKRRRMKVSGAGVKNLQKIMSRYARSGEAVTK